MRLTIRGVLLPRRKLWLVDITNLHAQDGIELSTDEERTIPAD